MKGQFVFLGALLAIHSCSAAVLWPELRIKFDVNVLNAYFHMGRSTNELNNNPENRFVQDPNQQSCVGEFDNGGIYYGYRHSDPEDSVLSLLYDVQGTVAGVQAWFLKDSVLLNPETSTFRFDRVWSYQNKTLNGKEFFVSTAYFVRPETICTTGRPESSLATEGTGIGLWLQRGASPLDNEEVPMTRTAAITKGWTRNSCFVGMGRHNFYQVDTYDATNCTQSEGYFLLYNRQEQLSGFGFRIQGLVESRYVEQPPNLAISLILGEPVPQCILDENTKHGSTTMHVFFTSSPWTDFCL
jgi:charged multivesicular body protein 7